MADPKNLATGLGGAPGAGPHDSCISSSKNQPEASLCQAMAQGLRFLKKGLGMINPAMWREAVLVLAAISFVFTILAIIGISQKDRPEFFGQSGTQPKLKFKDYKDCLLYTSWSSPPNCMLQP